MWKNFVVFRFLGISFGEKIRNGWNFGNMIIDVVFFVNECLVFVGIVDEVYNFCLVCML